MMISVLCPTRGRPSLSARLWRSIAQTVSHPGDVEIMIYLDNDDPEMEGYEAEIAAFRKDFPIELFVLIGRPAGGAVYAVNSLVVRMRGHMALVMCDDVVIETNGWDRRLCEAVRAYPDKVYLAWFNDGERKEAIALHPALSREVVSTLGYFCCPIFRHLYSDVYITELFKSIGRDVFISDVIARHDNPEYGTREEDLTDLHAKADFQLDRLFYNRVAPRLMKQDQALLQQMIDSGASAVTG